MSLRIHCDQCDEYMWRTSPGTEWTPHFAEYGYGNYVFCSDACLRRWVRVVILGEQVEQAVGVEH